MNKSLILLTVLLASAAVLYHMSPSPASPSATEYLSYLSRYSKPIPSGDQLIYRSKIYA